MKMNYELVVCFRVLKYFKANFYKNIGFCFCSFTLLLILIEKKFYKEVYSNFQILMSLKIKKKILNYYQIKIKFIKILVERKI